MVTQYDKQFHAAYLNRDERFEPHHYDMIAQHLHIMDRLRLLPETAAIQILLDMYLENSKFPAVGTHVPYPAKLEDCQFYNNELAVGLQCNNAKSHQTGDYRLVMMNEHGVTGIGVQAPKFVPQPHSIGQTVMPLNLDTKFVRTLKLFDLVVTDI